jgi:hypothetical protein
MNDKNKYKSNDYEMMKCIWMASGIVEFKLCNNQFECENCQFDKLIRNLSNEKETHLSGSINVPNMILDKLRNIKYDEKIIYLEHNLIAKEICPNTFYLGINPILISFLDAVSSMKVYEGGKNIFTEQQIVQFFGEWGTISLSAPMNFLIYDKFGYLTDNHLQTQWFAIIGVVQKEISSARLYQEGWNEMYEKALNIIEEIKLFTPKVGDTMLDGGNKIKFLHQLVGQKRYINILTSLCS